jgi:hypothetical protein
MKTSKIQRPYYWLKYELPELPAQAASKLHIHACQPKFSYWLQEGRGGCTGAVKNPTRFV